jgi:hypothetical protein
MDVDNNSISMVVREFRYSCRFDIEMMRFGKGQLY